MSEADRIDMDVVASDLASVREHLSLCSRAFSTATERIKDYEREGDSKYGMSKDVNQKSVEILSDSAREINQLALHLSRLEDYVLEYLGCRYEG